MLTSGKENRRIDVDFLRIPVFCVILWFLVERIASFSQTSARNRVLGHSSRADV